MKKDDLINDYQEQLIKKHNKVYEFWYNDCIHESAASCMSLHKTRKGAEMALDFHREEKRKHFEDLYAKHTPASPFGTDEAWGVSVREIFE